MFLRRTHVQQSKRWWHSPLLTLYESLTLTDQVQSVELIAVMAGRMERKQYGLDLLRAGLTPHLLLSVGRFEVSKIKCLELPCFEELLRLRDKTRPDERHFFVNLDRSGARVHTRADDRRYVLNEIVKLAGYKVILSMPAPAVRWLTQFGRTS